MSYFEGLINFVSDVLKFINRNIFRAAALEKHLTEIRIKWTPILQKEYAGYYITLLDSEVFFVSMTMNDAILKGQISRFPYSAFRV